jgi:hypothetical protein
MDSRVNSHLLPETFDFYFFTGRIQRNQQIAFFDWIESEVEAPHWQFDAGLCCFTLGKYPSLSIGMRMCAFN